jgi:hypothetical protein
MPVATSTPSASPRPSAMSKMEDRKRPAVTSGDDFAPPSKRQAVNGNKPIEADMDLKEDLFIEVSVTRLPTLLPMDCVCHPSIRLHCQYLRGTGATRRSAVSAQGTLLEFRAHHARADAPARHR